MCGLTGLAQRVWNAPLAQAFAAASERFMQRRGPDGFNVSRVTPQLMFTHARLSIIDIEGGAQPMGDDEGEIAFNGEIYNYQDLRESRIDYRTQSDTEVLLKGLNRYGTAFLESVDGMFAFAHYDRRRRRLTLARDAFGIKPLYYYADGRSIAFSSRLQPLMLLSRKEIDSRGLAEYYFTRACRAPRTIFTDIVEVLPGQQIVFDLETFRIVGESFWAKPDTVKRERTDPRTAVTDLENALRLSVDRHLIADVPVASFLSGGVDSSLITALAAERTPNLSAFTIGFHDKRFDESPFAAALCRKYNITHHVHYCDAPEFSRYLAEWPEIMDDVVADPSAVALYVVAQFTHDMGFKVVLCGDGGDELFGGYNQYYRFRLARSLHPYAKHFPWMEHVVRGLTGGDSRYVHFARTMISDPHYYGTGMIFEPHLVGKLVDKGEMEIARADTLGGALALDLAHRLPSDMLTRTDRATMHASIEARVPFLTRYVGEVARSLDEDLLVRGRRQKYLLKRLAEKYVPAKCIYRPKIGFDLPLAQWFRGEMRTRVLDTLATTWQADYLLPGAMQRVVEDHLSGRHDNADKIWAFMLLDGNVRYLRSIEAKDFVASYPQAADVALAG